MTRKKSFKKVFKYALPNVISMWVFTLYTMIDGIFISRFVGELGLAGVNMCFPLINLIFSIAIMIGVGSSTLISINLGKNQIEQGNKLLTLASLINLFVGIVISFLVYMNLEKVINFLGTNKNDEVYNYVKDYLSNIIFFSVFYMSGYAFEIYIKIDKNPNFPLKCVLVGGVTNIILDYILIAKYSYGIKGAAIATGISQIVSCIIMYAYIRFKARYIEFLQVDKKTFKKGLLIFKTGASEFVTEISTGLLILIYNIVILNRLGVYAVSIFGVVNYITSLIVMTMIGFSQGIQPLLSFNFGKKNYKALNALFKTSIFSLGTLGVISYFIINFFSVEIGKIFSEQLTFINGVKNVLNIYSFSYLLLGINIFIAAYFTAVKKVFNSILITLPRGIILNSLFLFILPDRLGENGIWLSAFFSEVVTLFISVYLLKKSKIIEF